MPLTHTRRARSRPFEHLCLSPLSTHTPSPAAPHRRVEDRDYRRSRTLSLPSPLSLSLSHTHSQNCHSHTYAAATAPHRSHSLTHTSHSSLHTRSSFVLHIVHKNAHADMRPHSVRSSHQPSIRILTIRVKRWAWQPPATGGTPLNSTHPTARGRGVGTLIHASMHMSTKPAMPKMPPQRA